MGRVNRHQARPPAKSGGETHVHSPASGNAALAPSRSNQPPQRRRAGWLWTTLAVFCALFFLAWNDHRRIERINYVSATATWSVDPPQEDERSPTGYAEGRRQLIVPGHHNPSYREISQTQQMIAGGAWRNRQVESVNFPHGCTTGESSIYRWWLAAVAWGDRFFSHRSPALAVEHGALAADPLLQVLLLISATMFTYRCLGPWAAGATTLALAALFPLAGGFQAGAPDHHSLAWACALWSVLPLVAGFLRQKPQPWFVMAGIAGGICLWTDHFTGEAVLLGISLGAACTVLIGRRSADPGVPPRALPWRQWGFAGALTCLIACLLEYFPKSTDWTIDSLHPLHAVAWVGFGELLHRGSIISVARARGGKWLNVAGWISASAAVLALPVVRMVSANGHFLAQDPFASELVNLALGVRAPDVWSWIARDGLTVSCAATFLPLAIVAFGIHLLFSRKTSSIHRSVLAITLLPILVALVLAWKQLRWWNGVDILIVPLIGVSVFILWQSGPGFLRRPWAVIFLCAMLPGISLLRPQPGSHANDPLNEIELQSVVERDLAHWLGHQPATANAVVLASPGVTETLAFHGNIKGIASYDPENRAGMSATIRMASASTWMEASALLTGRGITHVILPAWDSTLDRLAQVGRQLPPGSSPPTNTFVFHLKQWDLPLWLSAIPYHLPPEVDADRFAVRVFALGGEQDPVLAACRLADYFIEMNLTGELRAAREKLRLYPRSLPALIAVAQIDLSIGDAADFSSTLELLTPYLSRRAARTLPIDRRIGLAALLLQAKQTEIARTQIQQCLAELTPERLRGLTTGQIVRVLAMSDWAGIKFPDPALRATALSLLPPSLRARVAKATDSSP